MPSLCTNIQKKIDSNDDLFTVFYSKWCPYSMNALSLLKENKLSFKAYLIDDIKGEIKGLLNCLKDNKDITNFNIQHKTRPIIFHKKKFIGGYSDLEIYIKSF
jgi:glutaredoxin